MLHYVHLMSNVKRSIRNARNRTIGNPRTFHNGKRKTSYITIEI